MLEWARRIVGDARAMRDEVKALRQGLSGHLRLAVVPTALPVMARLTGPLAERHPEVVFTIRSCNSLEVLSLMENLEVDAGVTYVGSEPLGRSAQHVVVRGELPFIDRGGVAFGCTGGCELG